MVYTNVRYNRCPTQKFRHPSRSRGCVFPLSIQFSSNPESKRSLVCTEGKRKNSKALIMEILSQSLTNDPENHSGEMVKRLDILRKNQLFCDVTVTAGGTQFPTHKVVLAAASPFLQLFKWGICGRELRFAGLCRRLCAL